MAKASLLSLGALWCAFHAPSSAENLILNEYKQGSEFTKCVRISDFTSKTMQDAVDVVDRESSGCCPSGYIPGIKHYLKYFGAQIVCGFKDDGSVDLNAGSCDYGKCYFVNLNYITCGDGGKMMLNGCCSSWTRSCKKYSKSATFDGTRVSYCLSYTRKYALEGTSDKKDDQVTEDGYTSLDLTKLQTYTPCDIERRQPRDALLESGGMFSMASRATTTTTTTIVMVLNTLKQGSEFTKCISIDDFTTKGMNNAVSLVDRDGSGCCPKGYIPGYTFM